MSGSPPLLRRVEKTEFIVELTPRDARKLQYWRIAARPSGQIIAYFTRQHWAPLAHLLQDGYRLYRITVLTPDQCETIERQLDVDSGS